ncbi:hypothetical protein DL93DRAFT_1453593 [Clavulina sp. PMI_390]|nr:hypothetical protein DL93DRAFT_1453593 [Clavulina sp. PMI_390]
MRTTFFFVATLFATSALAAPSAVIKPATAVKPVGTVVKPNIPTSLPVGGAASSLLSEVEKLFRREELELAYAKRDASAIANIVATAQSLSPTDKQTVKTALINKVKTLQNTPGRRNDVLRDHMEGRSLPVTSGSTILHELTHSTPSTSTTSMSSAGGGSFGFSSIPVRLATSTITNADNFSLFGLSLHL